MKMTARGLKSNIGLKTIREMAASVGVAESTFYRWVSVGLLPKPTVLVGKRYHYDAKGVEAVISIMEKEIEK